MKLRWNRKGLKGSVASDDGEYERAANTRSKAIAESAAAETEEFEVAVAVVALVVLVAAEETRERETTSPPSTRRLHLRPGLAATTS